jgi:TonB family protein
MKCIAALFIALVLFNGGLSAQDLLAETSADLNKSETELSLLEYSDYAEILPKPIEGLKKIIEKIEYPLAAKAFRIEGTSQLLVYVNEQGKVCRIEPIRQVGFGCEEAAVEAFKNARFTPGSLGGKNVAVKIAIRVKFQLYSSSK